MSITITKAAATAGNFHRPTLFYRSAREGFADALKALLTEDNRRVLLPAFIGWSPREGSGVFDPIRQVDAQPGFYKPNPDLTVDLDALDRALAAFQPRVTVVIHYFGRTDPQLAEIGRIARRHNTILVEDLAHGFFSASIGDQAGQVGDFSLFSLHKMFPTASGGAVRYRDPALVTSQRATAAGLAGFIADYDWAGITRRRRDNFSAITALLAGGAAIHDHYDLLWPELDPADVPQTLPVRLHIVDRDAVYHAMNADGFGMTSLYHTMIDEVRETFPTMVALSRSIINFPVHQDMHPDQAAAMIDSFERAIASDRQNARTA